MVEHSPSSLAYASLPFVVEPMVAADIDEVMVLERQAFVGAPWSASAYRHELSLNEMAHYSVVRTRHTLPARPRARKRALLEKLIAPREQEPAARLPPILAYGGFWLMQPDAHISTIATAPAWRGRHLGELLLVALIDQAQALGAQRMTLEVRSSNSVAQALYHKYRFAQTGRERGYYSDNGEDALTMATDRIDRAEFQQVFAARKRQLWEKLIVPYTK